MIALVRLTLKIPDEDQAGVRIAYGASSKTGSAPVHNPENSVCYIYVNPTDDGYGKQHHISYVNGEQQPDSMREVDDYTEEYAVTFSFYGGDAYDRARKHRDSIYSLAVKEFLSETHIHPKMGIPAIVQTHDNINTFWVKRCDLTVTFYAHVRIVRENTVSNIEEINISFKQN
jgi:hypothetical protein